MFDTNSSMPINDPWGSSGSSHELCSASSESNKFEDSFTATEVPPVFEKLDDSAEYLERLERKLKRLQTPSKRDTLLKALSERRSDENRRLTVINHYFFINIMRGQIKPVLYALFSFQNSNERPIEEEFPSDDTVILDNLVLRRIFPDKQAINQGELQKLLEADILELINQKHQELSNQVNATDSVPDA